MLELTIGGRYNWQNQPERPEPSVADRLGTW